MRDVLACTVGGLELKATVWRPEQEGGACAVLYLHGGGLLYGERDDLPKRYVDLFLSRGYQLWCMDYPLAPETPLPTIASVLVGEWAWFAEQAMARGAKKLLVFGRSAGAYLALLLTKRLAARPDLPQPAAVIDFYGYHDLMDPAFWEPCATYASLPAVSEKTVLALTSGGPVTSGPFELRFALYIHARQTGDWVRMLGVDEDQAREQSLTPDDVAALPPLFVTASTDDGDVPYRIPKSLFRAKRGTKMVTVYHLEHDFDRDVSKPEGLDTYRQAITWMEGRLAV